MPNALNDVASQYQEQLRQEYEAQQAKDKQEQAPGPCVHCGSAPEHHNASAVTPSSSEGFVKNFKESL